jgi:hypothetical protein
VARKEAKTKACRIFVWITEDTLEKVGVNGRIFLQCIYKAWNRSAWTGLIWLRVRAIGELFCSR